MEKHKQFLSKVWRPVLQQFDRTVERACLRRDAFLDQVLNHEARILKSEIPSPNSAEARNYLQRQLEQLERVPVNFSLSPSTIQTINKACDELNIIRDCFINRVLFLLASNVERCEGIVGISFREELTDILGDHDRDFLYAPIWGGSLHAIAELATTDPFRGVRNIIAHHIEQGDELVNPLHARLIRPELFSKKPAGVLALNCYMPDECIPGSPAAKALDELLDDLLGELTPQKPRSAMKKTKTARRAK